MYIFIYRNTLINLLLFMFSTSFNKNKTRNRNSLAHLGGCGAQGTCVPPSIKCALLKSKSVVLQNVL